MHIWIIKMATSTEVLAMKSSSGKTDAEYASDLQGADLRAMMEEIKRLRMENEEFKKRQRPVTFGVNEKGAVSMYGLGKYPVTLYKLQWERIMTHIEPLKQYIKEHEYELN